MNPSPSLRGPESPLTPESSMRVSRPAHRAVSVLCVSIVLVACSGGLSAQSPRTQIAQAPPPAVAAGAAATAGGGACAICRRGDWALRPPEQATSTMETHNTETARWAGRETLILDSGVRGLSGPRDEGLGFIRAPIKLQHLACPRKAAGRKIYASTARTPGPPWRASQSASFQHERTE